MERHLILNNTEQNILMPQNQEGPNKVMLLHIIRKGYSAKNAISKPLLNKIMKTVRIKKI